MTTPVRALWAPVARLEGGWRERVLIEVDAGGHFSRFTPDVDAPNGVERLPGIALPALVNAHSHAFQRAFAGLTERREGSHDDFWSWRERMYTLALRLSPQALRAIAAQLYAELLAGGYTQVCEFHYLHHAPDGRAYAEPLAMSAALAEAASDAGIGLTLLPVLYERGGFDDRALDVRQRRFATTVEQVLEMRRGIARWRLPRVNAGLALHSLRAVRPQSLAQLVNALPDDEVPIHIHIAEQTREVDDCLHATGCRPIEWLCRHARPDARWQLVHATHALAREVEALAGTGAAVIVCPSTEANLGDGVFDLPLWLGTDVPLAIGSDSQVCRHWPQELRLLEYGQRLTLRRRGVAAQPQRGQTSTAAALFESCVRSGPAAAGLRHGGLRAGARADLLVVDPKADALRGMPRRDLLDVMVFATDAPVFDQVWVAGQCQVRQGQHCQSVPIAERFEATLADLYPD